MTETDMVNHPPHYKKGGIEAIDVIEAFLGTEGAYFYCRGNAIKYQLRADEKGRPVQDHEKTVWYANKAAELHKKWMDADPPF